MPDFTGPDRIWLRPGTDAYPVTFFFAPSSSVAADDGSIPYGTTITGASVAGYDEAGAAATALVDAGSVVVGVDALTVACTLTAGTLAEGAYSLLVTLTLSTAAVVSFWARRVFVTAMV